MVSIPQKNNFVKFILQKNEFFQIWRVLDGDERIWTADLLVANQMLSQLSYTPKRHYVVYTKKP